MDQKTSVWDGECSMVRLSVMVICLSSVALRVKDLAAVPFVDKLLYEHRGSGCLDIICIRENLH